MRVAFTRLPVEELSCLVDDDRLAELVRQFLAIYLFC